MQPSQTEDPQIEVRKKLLLARLRTLVGDSKPESDPPVPVVPVVPPITAFPSASYVAMAHPVRTPVVPLPQPKKKKPKAKKVRPPASPYGAPVAPATDPPKKPSTNGDEEEGEITKTATQSTTETASPAASVDKLAEGVFNTMQDEVDYEMSLRRIAQQKFKNVPAKAEPVKPVLDKYRDVSHVLLGLDARLNDAETTRTIHLATIDKERTNATTLQNTINEYQEKIKELVQQSLTCQQTLSTTEKELTDLATKERYNKAALMDLAALHNEQNVDLKDKGILVYCDEWNLSQECKRPACSRRHQCACCDSADHALAGCVFIQKKVDTLLDGEEIMRQDVHNLLGLPVLDDRLKAAVCKNWNYNLCTIKTCPLKHVCEECGSTEHARVDGHQDPLVEKCRPPSPVREEPPVRKRVQELPYYARRSISPLRERKRGRSRDVMSTISNEPPRRIIVRDRGYSPPPRVLPSERRPMHHEARPVERFEKSFVIERERSMRPDSRSSAGLSLVDASRRASPKSFSLMDDRRHPPAGFSLLSQSKRTSLSPPPWTRARPLSPNRPTSYYQRQTLYDDDMKR